MATEMTESITTCVVINKRNATLRPSESFLHAHIERLPGRKLPLIGMPGARRAGVNQGPFLLSQALFPRAVRWALRKSGISTEEAQDTRSLGKYLRRARPDVVLAEYGPSALGIMDACAATEIPLVTHFHGWDAYVLASDPEQSAAYRQLFEKSAAIVAVSQHMQAHLRSLGAPANKVIWNPCGAEPDAAIPAQPDKAPPRYISVGRPAPKKATIVSLLAFSDVLKTIPDARLELIGGGLDDYSRQTVRALKIEHAVSFLGALPHDEVLQHIRKARCYIHPSVTAPDGDMEGTPVSVLEAMAAGLPVVSTKHGGINDVLDGTTAGILVDEYDVEATAEAMLVYGESAARAARDGTEGRRLLVENWSMDRSISKLGEIINLAKSRDDSALAMLACPSH